MVATATLKHSSIFLKPVEEVPAPKQGVAMVMAGWGLMGQSRLRKAPLLLACMLAGTPSLCLAAGGSSLTMADSGMSPLGETAPARSVVAAHIQTAMFEPAPVPDRDAIGPNGTIDPRAGVGPRLLSSKDGFEGEGFFKGSSEHASVDSRKQPAAGLGLNMPLGDAKTP